MIGSKIAHYQVERELGRGGMGVVYLAEDTKLGRKVAIKSLPPEFSSDTQRRRRFEQEAHAVAALNHPNIAVVHGLEEQDGGLYIVFEYVEGASLRSLISESVPLVSRVKTMAGVARGLAAAHGKNVIHRDLKPENILMAASGDAKILDFGLAQMQMDWQDASTRSTPLTQAGAVVGTVAYMSPEQLECRELDARSDIFACGVVLYELSTGKHPFQGASAASTIANVLTQEPRPPSTLNPSSPTELERIVRKCLRKDREERYQSAQDLALDLAQLAMAMASGSAALAPSPTATTVIVEEKRRLFTPFGWWVWHQLYMNFIALPLTIYLAWKYQEWDQSDPPMASAIFSIVVFTGAISFMFRGYLIVMYMFQRDLEHLGREVKRFFYLPKGFTAFGLELLAIVSLSVANAHPIGAAVLAFAGVSGILLELIVEPAIDRMAFPTVFEEKLSAEEQKVRKSTQTMAGIQCCYVLLYSAPFLSGRFHVNALRSDLSWGFAGLAMLVMVGVAGCGGSLGFAVQWWRRDQESLDTFLRFFALFYAFDLMAVALWFVNVSEKNSALPILIFVGTLPAMLYMPFWQRKKAIELGASVRPAQSKKILDWDARTQLVFVKVLYLCAAAYMAWEFGRKLDRTLAGFVRGQDKLYFLEYGMFLFATISLLVGLWLVTGVLRRHDDVIRVFRKGFLLFAILDVAGFEGAMLASVRNLPLVAAVAVISLFGYGFRAQYLLVNRLSQELPSGGESTGTGADPATAAGLAERKKRFLIAGIQMLLIAPNIVTLLYAGNWFERAVTSSEEQSHALMVLASRTFAVAFGMFVAIYSAYDRKGVRFFLRYFPLVILCDVLGVMILVAYTREMINISAAALVFPAVAALPWWQYRLANTLFGPEEAASLKPWMRFALFDDYLKLALIKGVYLAAVFYLVRAFGISLDHPELRSLEPLEISHAVQIGLFLYSVSAFFAGAWVEIGLLRRNPEAVRTYRELFPGFAVLEFAGVLGAGLAFWQFSVNWIPGTPIWTLATMALLAQGIRVQYRLATGISREETPAGGTNDRSSRE